MIFRFSSHSFSVVIVLIVVLHLVIAVGFDLYIYRNKQTRSEWIGIAMAVGAILLLTNGEQNE